MAEQQNGNDYPKVVCEKCKTEMQVIGVGTASGRLKYRCPACGVEFLGKNLIAMRHGSLGGKARASRLSPEKRQEIAEKAGNAFAEKIRERKKESSG